jgi:hypothetical protein
MTWGRLPFEFAHFTDRQLADALLKLSPIPYREGRDALIARIARERASKKPNVDRVWPRAGIKNLKVSMANEMWPLLERRMEQALTRGTQGPRVMAAAVRAYELATLSYRHTVSVRRRSPS